jgi:MoxR-like ATPase
MSTVPTDLAESELIARLASARERLLDELSKAIVGQRAALEQVILAVLCRGHVLLEGVPGLAKTVLVQSLGRCLDCSSGRVSFTPDLVPSDITGADIIQEDPETGRRQFEFLPGPIFANLVLADEINRCPPKTQAALLEAMQERRVTVRGRSYELPDPFVVLATQNPIEQEGTYPLPEAQLDRFFFLVRLGYPARDEEIEVLRRTTTGVSAVLKRVLSAHEVVQLQDLVRSVPAPDPVLAYAADLARATRPADGHPEARRWLSWGAGPRGAQVLVLAAKARALLSGRFHASCDDVAAIVLPALRHRIVPSFAAQAEGLDADAVLGRIVPEVKRP